MSNAEHLALWVLHHSSGPITHLKLQKLCFYCYGAALASDTAGDVGADLVFEAWDHGPVLREVWTEYRKYGSAQIPVTGTAPTYQPDTACALADALTVYGLLSPWSLRQESHLEGPWIETRKAGTTRIDPEAMRAFFVRKFGGPGVRFPEHLQRWSLGVDGIPSHEYPSLRELAAALRDN